MPTLPEKCKHFKACPKIQNLANKHQVYSSKIMIISNLTRKHILKHIHCYVPGKVKLYPDNIIDRLCPEKLFFKIKMLTRTNVFSHFKAQNATLSALNHLFEIFFIKSPCLRANGAF